jgi:hypothetical protein
MLISGKGAVSRLSFFMAGATSIEIIDNRDTIETVDIDTRDRR